MIKSIKYNCRLNRTISIFSGKYQTKPILGSFLFLNNTTLQIRSNLHREKFRRTTSFLAILKTYTK